MLLEFDMKEKSCILETMDKFGSCLCGYKYKATTLNLLELFQLYHERKS